MRETEITAREQAHESQHPRVRPVMSLSEAEVATLMRYALDYAIDEGRAAAVLGLDRVSGAAVLCEAFCPPCLAFDDAVLVVPDLVLIRVVANGGDVDQHDASTLLYQRDDGRSAKIIRL
jgi:hypothetical protein